MSGDFAYLRWAFSPPASRILGATVRSHDNMVAAPRCRLPGHPFSPTHGAGGLCHLLRRDSPHGGTGRRSTAWCGCCFKSACSTSSSRQALTTGVMRFPLVQAHTRSQRHPRFPGAELLYPLSMWPSTCRTPGSFSGSASFPPGTDVSDTNHIANVPEGMFQALNWCLQFNCRSSSPRTGLKTPTTTCAPRYLVQHLHQVWRGVNFNWPVKGYFHWTLVDNFEWERGWSQRFGLWELDGEPGAPQTPQRRPVRRDLQEQRPLLRDCRPLHARAI